MPAETVQKAIIENLSTKKKVECHFNPAEFTVAKSAKWEMEESTGSDTPTLHFSGGESQDMTVTFLFDSTTKGGAQVRDVRDEYKELVNLVMVDPDSRSSTTDRGEPPMCQFQWGKFLAFDAVITKLDQKFTMFATDGTPLRAEVSATFKQVGEERRPQNPTTRSEARKTWVVLEGQTLDWIAYQEYGNPAYWRHVAETNNLDDPLALYPGQILKLVPPP
jgi:hypothetical protein